MFFDCLVGIGSGERMRAEAPNETKLNHRSGGEGGQDQKGKVVKMKMKTQRNRAVGCSVG
jgi:hypothetical protein